jgi:hypothetical protein
MASVTSPTCRAVTSHHTFGIALAATIAPRHSLPHVRHQWSPYPLTREWGKLSCLSAFRLALL